MTNPLLETHELPPFTDIRPEQVEPAIEKLIDENRNALEAQLAGLKEVTWDSLIEPIDTRNDMLNQAWSPVSHLNSVVNSDALREAYNNCVGKLAQWETEVGQNQGLFQAYKTLSESEHFARLTQAQRHSIKLALQSFHLSGVSLPKDKKQQFSRLTQRLAELSSTFGDNLMDATQAWNLLISDAEELAGVTDSSLALFAQAAAEKDQSGYLLTLDQPCFIAVMTYADSRPLREQMYQAFTTRASDQGPYAGQWDNSAIIDETLKLRHELSQILGLGNAAEVSLAPKMASSTSQVMSFLNDLAKQVKPQAEKEFAELSAFAKTELQIDHLEAWDIAYVSEKLRTQRYAISVEELRPWFPVERVLEGLYSIAGRLFDISIEQDRSVDLWHKDARFYRISRNGQAIASFYLDLYAREKKQGGAWMDVCRSRRKVAETVQLPVAYLTCNFTPPVAGKSALLTHDEVTTLFHEFGHGLHHMLTQVEVLAVSGINGVAWDAVELPSQFLENWCWQEESIELISAHFESGEALPKAMLDKLLAAKNFQSGMALARQLEFATFDFRLHLEYDPSNPRSSQELLDEVREHIAVIKVPEYNRFQNGFGHIFAGGYSAGYYSYLWAEVLSADAFSLFEEQGIFDQATGDSFRAAILEKGGSDEAMTLFVQFRGREPSNDALLRHRGIA
ncbi:Oligopeptidase A [Gammaproteobacteria bacterium MOLA455]|nr:Oligopeptidase A [Gammaproteobacteria bacterium MOLA455]